VACRRGQGTSNRISQSRRLRSNLLKEWWALSQNILTVLLSSYWPPRAARPCGLTSVCVAGDNVQSVVRELDQLAKSNVGSIQVSLLI